MANKTYGKPAKVGKKPAPGRGGAKAANHATPAGAKEASRLIDERIRDLAGWRGQTLARMRALILQADAGMTEEVKWRGTPVWSHDGIVCTGEAYAKVVKLTFARGASLPDPARLFNSSLEGNTRRAIDIREGETVDASAFKALVKAAVAHNAGGGKGAGDAGARGRRRTVRGSKGSAGGAKTAGTSEPRAAAKPKLLSGDNPQVAKGDGDAPVQAYIAAIPGWKQEVGRRLDACVVRTVPGVRKAVKWNSPFYGVEGKGWFLAFHCFTKYVKVTFFRGASLRPVPPGESKDKSVRYLDIREGDEPDGERVADWIRQAAELPGWVP